MPLTKFNYNSFDLTTAASTGLAFNASANGFDTADPGAMTLISTNTISSGVSSSSFTSGIDSTYDTYLFKLINIHLSANQFLGFNLSVDGGSNYNVAKTSSSFRTYQDEGGNFTAVQYVTSDDLAQGTGIQYVGDCGGASADECLSGTIYLFSPSNTTFVKHYIVTTNRAQAAYSGGHYIAGYGNTTSAINAIQFSATSSATIDSGVIKMYGITK
tara:strand:+ start:579 stop:1223 length:645 start_codon:yes stop_codon:yes gene_type:complete